MKFRFFSKLSLAKLIAFVLSDVYEQKNRIQSDKLAKIAYLEISTPISKIESNKKLC